MNNGRGPSIIVPALLLAAGIALAGYFIGGTLYKSRIGINTAQAKGLSERRVKADQADWAVTFSVSGKSREEIPQLYELAEQQQAVIIANLKDSGLLDEEVSADVINYNFREYRNENQELVDEAHFLNGAIRVRTGRVDQIANSRNSINSLIAKGIQIGNGMPSYRFNGLNEIKPDMLREAARNARIAANEFAENAGLKVGKIRSASQGAFFIQDVGQSGGDSREIEKDVRVVTTVDFYLVD